MTLADIDWDNHSSDSENEDEGGFRNIGELLVFFLKTRPVEYHIFFTHFFANNYSGQSVLEGELERTFRKGWVGGLGILRVRLTIFYVGFPKLGLDLILSGLSPDLPSTGEKYLRAFFAKFDADSDGQITLEEWEALSESELKELYQLEKGLARWVKTVTTKKMNDEPSAGKDEL